MGRSPLFTAVRKFLRRAHAANTLGLSAEEAATAKRHGPSRREMFLGSLAAGALVPLVSACGDNKQPPGDDQSGIVIIGGGIAGMTVAYFLRLARLQADVYESSQRIGGRMFTDRTSMKDGQIIELGGELVDSDHLVIQSLMQVHGFALDDLEAATDGLEQDLFFFDGAPVPAATIVTAFMPVALKMAAAVMNTDGTSQPAMDLFTQIDNMSIPEWLQDATLGPGLAKGTLIRRILEVSYLEEFGLEVDEQSAWNLITLIDYETPDPFHVFGDSDERYHTHAGNDSLPLAMADQLPDLIHLGHALTKVEATGDTFALTFDTEAGPHVVTATHVIYALPFTRLRDVDLTASGLSQDKLDTIKNLGYGTNAKLMMQFTNRPWESGPRASSGGCITNAGDSPADGSALGSGLQTTWSTSRGQAGPKGILTNFVGGHRGLDMAMGTAEDQAQKVLPWIDQVFPGSQLQYIPSSAVRMHWPTYPHVKASYASYLKGQWAYFGTEGVREGNQHFCGEHTSEDFQGYMEGGAESGARVASELLDDLDVEYPPLLTDLTAMTAERRTRGARSRIRDAARRSASAHRAASRK